MDIFLDNEVSDWDYGESMSVGPGGPGANDDGTAGEMDPQERAQMMRHKDDIHKQNLKHADDRHGQFLKHNDELHKQTVRHRDEVHRQNLTIAKQQNAGMGQNGAMYMPAPTPAQPPAPPQAALVDRDAKGATVGTGGTAGSSGGTGLEA